MELQLKQRVIGAVVIFSLLIIFLPMFFESTDNIDDGQTVENLLIPVVNAQEGSPDIKAKIALLKQKLSNTETKVNIESEIPQVQAVSKVKEIVKDNLKDNTEVIISTNKLVEPKATNITKKSNELEPKLEENQTIAQVKAKTAVSDNNKNNIAYNIDKKLFKHQAYAIQINVNNKNFDYSSLNNVNKIKDLLLNIGLPAYVKYDNTKKIYNIYVGPDLELKYIKELAKRVIEETDYSALVMQHDTKVS